MDEVFVDMRNQNEWIKKYFTTDFVSIEQLISCIEDLDGDIDNLKEQIKELNEPEDENPDAYDEWRDRQ